MTDLSALSDSQCLKALQISGRILPIRTGSGAPGLMLRAIQELDLGIDATLVAALTGKAADLESHAKAAAIARHALAVGLELEAAPEVRGTVREAIDLALEAPVEESILGVMAIGAATLVALAVISKVRFKDGKLEVVGGLPGIEDAGKAIGHLIGGVLPG